MNLKIGKFDILLIVSSLVLLTCCVLIAYNIIEIQNQRSNIEKQQLNSLVRQIFFKSEKSRVNGYYCHAVLEAHTDYIYFSKHKNYMRTGDVVDNFTYTINGKRIIIDVKEKGEAIKDIADVVQEKNGLIISFVIEDEIFTRNCKPNFALLR